MLEATNEHDEDAQEAGRALGKAIADTLNGHSLKYVVEGMAIGLLNSHRTLQQMAVGSMAEALLRYAELAKEGGFTDLRNEAAVKGIHAQSAALRQLTRLPFV